MSFIFRFFDMFAPSSSAELHVDNQKNNKTAIGGLISIMI